MYAQKISDLKDMWIDFWPPSYDHRSTFQSFGKKLLHMGNVLKKCKVVLKDARFFVILSKAHAFEYNVSMWDQAHFICEE